MGFFIRPTEGGGKRPVFFFEGFPNHNCALPVLIEAYFLLILFCIYDNLTKDHVPGLQKYDICMTEQVSGSRRVKIEGRHLAMVP